MTDIRRNPITLIDTIGIGPLDLLGLGAIAAELELKLLVSYIEDVAPGNDSASGSNEEEKSCDCNKLYRQIDALSTGGGQDESIRKLLGAVCQNEIPEDLWKRIKAVAAPAW